MELSRYRPEPAAGKPGWFRLFDMVAGRTLAGLYCGLNAARYHSARLSGLPPPRLPEKKQSRPKQ